MYTACDDSSERKKYFTRNNKDLRLSVKTEETSDQLDGPDSGGRLHFVEHCIVTNE